MLKCITKTLIMKELILTKKHKEVICDIIYNRTLDFIKLLSIILVLISVSILIMHYINIIQISWIFISITVISTLILYVHYYLEMVDDNNISICGIPLMRYKYQDDYHYFEIIRGNGNIEFYEKIQEQKRYQKVEDMIIKMLYSMLDNEVERKNKDIERKSQSYKKYNYNAKN